MLWQFKWQWKEDDFIMLVLFVTIFAELIVDSWIIRNAISWDTCRWASVFHTDVSVAEEAIICVITGVWCTCGSSMDSPSVSIKAETSVDTVWLLQCQELMFQWANCVRNVWFLAPEDGGFLFCPSDRVVCMVEDYEDYRKTWILPWSSPGHAWQLLKQTQCVKAKSSKY